MKKTFLSTALIAALVAVSCGGTQDPQLQKLETQKEILALNTKLNSLQIELEKEKNSSQELNAEASSS